MKNVSENYIKAMGNVFRPRSEIKIEWIRSVSGNSTSVFFDSSLVENVEINNEVDPLSRRLPTEEAIFSIIDFDGLFDSYSPNYIWNNDYIGSVVKIQFGLALASGIEWLPAETYRITEAPTFQDDKATFRAAKILSCLTGTFYKGALDRTTSGKTMLDVANEVISDCRLVYGTDFSFSVDSFLSSIKTSAPVPLCTHAEALQLIANASGCALYTSENTIYIKRPFTPLQSTDGVQKITPLDFAIARRDLILKSEQESNTDSVKNSICNYHQYVVSDFQEKEIARASVDSSFSGTLHIEFPLAEVSSVSKNGNIVSTDSYKAYARAIDIQVTAGTEANYIVNGFSWTDWGGDWKNSDESGVYSIDNEMITSYPNRLAGQNAIKMAKSYYSVTKYLDSATRGNPELDMLDAVKYITNDDTVEVAVLIQQKLVYDGSLSGNSTYKVMQEYKQVSTPTIAKRYNFRMMTASDVGKTFGDEIEAYLRIITDTVPPMETCEAIELDGGTEKAHFLVNMDDSGTENGKITAQLPTFGGRFIPWVVYDLNNGGWNATNVDRINSESYHTKQITYYNTEVAWNTWLQVKDKGENPNILYGSAVSGGATYELYEVVGNEYTRVYSTTASQGEFSFDLSKLSLSAGTHDFVVKAIPASSDNINYDSNYSNVISYVKS